MQLSFLPEEGLHGVLYLYLTPQKPPVEQEEWSLLVWSGKSYVCHLLAKSLEELHKYADTLLWAKDWERVECCSNEKLVNPCVRVEFEYMDGRIQRLEGADAEKWLRDVNNVLVLGALRHGTSGVGNYPWTYTKKDK